MSSYFARHKQALNNNKSRVSKTSINNPSKSNIPSNVSNSISNDIKSLSNGGTHTIKIQQQRQKSQNQSYVDLQFGEEKTQEQKVYEQYKEIKAMYEKELQQIHIQIENIKKQTETESKRVKQAEIILQAKKKELKAIKQKYEETISQYKKQQAEEASENKIASLQSQLAEITQKNVEKIKELNEEEQRMKQQNTDLEQKLEVLQKQYTQALLFDHTQYEEEKKRLQEQEDRLKKELQELEKEGQKVKKDIQKIQDMKPVSSDVHKRYLDLFEKMFISQQLAKAQKIMGLKQEERKYNIELSRRNQWLKQKQKQIQERQARIAQKNKLVDKLTTEIREKSTLLLTKYQVQSDRHWK